MDGLEVNIKLKEDIKVLEEEYKDLMKACQSKARIPETVYGNLRIVSLMCHEQVKAQRGEESCQCKFDTVESFAKHLGMMSDINLKWLEEKFGCEKYTH